MKTIIISVSALLLIFFSSCEKKENNDIPNAFENNTSEYSSFSKRENSDLISNLYKEIIEKNKELKALEDSISELRKTMSDKTKNINLFFENNQDYYNAAYERIEIIQDSVLREKIFKKLSESENNYNSETEKLTAILAEISQKQAELNDYYNALVILKTMKRNEQYQKENLPDTNVIYGLKAEYSKIINLVKELTDK